MFIMTVAIVSFVLGVLFATVMQGTDLNKIIDALFGEMPDDEP